MSEYGKQVGKIQIMKNSGSVVKKKEAKKPQTSMQNLEKNKKTSAATKPVKPSSANNEASICFANSPYFESYHKALAEIISENIYLENKVAPTLCETIGHQQSLLDCNDIAFYAIRDEEVVGWIFIRREATSQRFHRGKLNMAITKKYRGMGVGQKLVKAALDHAHYIGIEKIEIQVFSNNIEAISLFEKFGFTDEGVIRDYHRLHGESISLQLLAKVFE